MSDPRSAGGRWATSWCSGVSPRRRVSSSAPIPGHHDRATPALSTGSSTSCTACSASRARSSYAGATDLGPSACSLGGLGLLTAVTTVYLALRPRPRPPR